MEEEPLLPSSSSSQLQYSTSSVQNRGSERFEIYQQRSNLDPENQQSLLINPNYPVSKTNLHRSKSAPAMSNIGEIDNFPEIKRPHFGKPSIIRHGVMLLVIYLCFGVIIYMFNRDNFRGTKTNPLVDAIYFCTMTMCTIGYVDITPISTVSKLFSITYVLVWFGFLDILLTGMVSYMLDLQENYLLRAIMKRGTHESESFIIDLKKGRMRFRMKAVLALGVVVICIGTGVTFMHFVERVDWFDSFYLSVMAVTTVGYGDRVFSSLAGRIFASVWLFVSTLAVARAFLFLAEARVDKRDRRMAKWVLSQDMTVAQFLAADIDNDGFVSKSEYVIFKLKEMGKVSENDILLICKQFEGLDSSNCGKITLADLMKRSQ